MRYQTDTSKLKQELKDAENRGNLYAAQSKYQESVITDLASRYEAAKNARDTPMAISFCDSINANYQTYVWLTQRELYAKDTALDAAKDIIVKTEEAYNSQKAILKEIIAADLSKDQAYEILNKNYLNIKSQHGKWFDRWGKYVLGVVAGRFVYYTLLLF